MAELGPLLPARYAPLTPKGNGLQSVYLTELPAEFAKTMADLISKELGAIARLESANERPQPKVTPELVLWELHLQEEIETSTSIRETEKEALVLARRGQGVFRQRVQERESSCRVTGVNRPEHLRASHCKPWRDCSSHEERLSADNGLMLTPSVDHLFDRGFISFESSGRLLVSPVAHQDSLHRMGIPADGKIEARPLSTGQQQFLEYHRDMVFLKSRLRA
jgi:putative restriction endonuclease